jgi:hypothetical protein
MLSPLPRVAGRSRRLCLLLVGALACSSVEPTALPDDARRFTPEPIFESWWQQIEECSARTADFSLIEWYVVPGEDPFIAPPLGREVLGYWDGSADRIVLLEYVENRSALVRHEILHAVLRRGDHPPRYFQTLCGSVINGPGLPPD